nr:winged helix-turn-helix domain-containing protein [Streptomyces colonosanans]
MQLEAELAKGLTAHGWEEQRWTLSRVKKLIGRRFHLTYTIQGVRKLRARNGWSCQEIRLRKRPRTRTTGVRPRCDQVLACGG